ncbi:MAG: tetratricopeptide repeat protein [Polyangiaceae bacterium]
MRVFVVSIFFASAVTVASGARANASSDELVRQGKLHEAFDEADRALRSYTDALAIDPTSGDAYLGLGRVRLRLGQAHEAERVYSTALEHVPTLTDALAGRAHARRALRAYDLADGDLADYAKTTQSVLSWRELAKWYGEEGRFTAELSVWRGLLEFAETHSDGALEASARVETRALVALAKPIDPAAYPTTNDFTRGALANIARRGG